MCSLPFVWWVIQLPAILHGNRVRRDLNWSNVLISMNINDSVHTLKTPSPEMFQNQELWSESWIVTGHCCSIFMPIFSKANQWSVASRISQEEGRQPRSYYFSHFFLRTAWKAWTYKWRASLAQTFVYISALADPSGRCRANDFLHSK